MSTYNPDVLSCLANLSNDEVFTPPELANQMLDLLPQELFKHPDTTFLDPCCKSGVFLREIAKRLIRGLEPQFPDLEQRIKHIFSKQIFGIAITDLTGLLSRRSVYCSKFPSKEFSAYRFPDDKPQGNIRYQRVPHSWTNNRCIFCGASKDEYDRSDELENHAYEFIHNISINNLFNMKFDVIIGNPPYHLSDGSGGSSDSAIPIYNKFILQAIKLNPRYLSMIIPSKWMVGGRGLNKFREEFASDTRIKHMCDYVDESKCFNGIHIDGGVCYFLWDREYSGKTEYKYIAADGTVVTTSRYLKSNYFNYIIRDSRILTILEKCHSNDKFSSIVSNVRPFGIRGYLFNSPERYPMAQLNDKPFTNSIKIYGVKGIKGGARRKTGYITSSTVTNNHEWINKYKLFFTTSYSTNAIKPPEVIIGMPNEICTETFLVIGPFNTENEQKNCLSYINTRFFKFLLFFGKGTIHVTSTVFGLIPLQDFSKPWTDEELYAQYSLTEDEITFIESVIPTV